MCRQLWSHHPGQGQRHKSRTARVPKAVCKGRCCRGRYKEYAQSSLWNVQSIAECQTSQESPTQITIFKTNLILFFFIKQSSFEGSIFMGSNKLIFNPKSYRQNNTCRFLSLKIQRSLLLPWQNIRPKSTPNNKPASNEHGWRHWNQENKN